MATVGPISQYDILRKLARGGMGEVYLARQTGIEGFAKEVVLKRIHANYAENAQFVRMFLQEARIAALLDHPNIVQIYELGKHGPDYFIVMEYVKGLSLSRLLKAAGGPLPHPIAIQIAAGVAAGLQFAHDKKDPKNEPLNLVHRDISPPNILLSTSGSIKITDFGIAKIRSSVTHTQAGVIKGKYSYISPEQARGEQATRKSDIYSLGLILYEMTTGKRAYPAGSDKDVLRSVALGQVPPPELHVTNFPEDLRAVVMRALEPDLEIRYKECQELQEDLLALLVTRRIVTSPAKLGQFVQEMTVELEIDDQLSGPTTKKQIEPIPIGPKAQKISMGKLLDLDEPSPPQPEPISVVELETADGPTATLRPPFSQTPHPGEPPPPDDMSATAPVLPKPHLSPATTDLGYLPPAVGQPSSPPDLLDEKTPVAVPPGSQDPPIKPSATEETPVVMQPPPPTGPPTMEEAPEVLPPHDLHLPVDEQDRTPVDHMEVPAPVGDDDFDDDAETIMVDRAAQEVVETSGADVVVVDPAELQAHAPQPDAPKAEDEVTAVDKVPTEAEHHPVQENQVLEEAAAFEDKTVEQSGEDIALMQTLAQSPAYRPAPPDGDIPSAFAAHEKENPDPPLQEPSTGSLTGATGEMQAKRLRTVIPLLVVVGVVVITGSIITAVLLTREPDEPIARNLTRVDADTRTGSTTLKGDSTIQAAASPDTAVPLRAVPDAAPQLPDTVSPVSSTVDAAVDLPPPTPSKVQKRRSHRLRRRGQHRRRSRSSGASAKKKHSGGDDDLWMTDFSASKLPSFKLSLKTEPIADVYLGKKRLGRTPMSAKVPKRKLTLTFVNRRLGLNTTRKLTPGGTQIATRYVFRRGVLSFQIPAGMRVYLDGKLLGVSPIKSKVVYEGQHTVVYRRQGGRKRYVRRVTVKPNKTTRVKHR